MTKLYDILKTAKTGIATDNYTALIGKYMSKKEKEYELTDIPPLTFESSGRSVNTWTIWGNTEQNITPTPSNPTDVLGIGTPDNDRCKIQISCGDTPTSVFIGEVATTRQVKKLVLTGNESWGRNDNCFRLTLPDSSNTAGRIISTHFANKGAWTLINTNTTGACVSAAYYGASFKYLMIRCDDIAITTADFKTWLAQEYANGTPVIVWYVMQNPETAVISEPLMKIGDYTDSISNAISIPTVEGNNILTIDTDIQPSQMYIKYYK